MNKHYRLLLAKQLYSYTITSVTLYRGIAESKYADMARNKQTLPVPMRGIAFFAQEQHTAEDYIEDNGGVVISKTIQLTTTDNFYILPPNWGIAFDGGIDMLQHFLQQLLNDDLTFFQHPDKSPPTKQDIQFAKQFYHNIDPKKYLVGNDEALVRIFPKALSLYHTFGTDKTLSDYTITLDQPRH